MDRIGNISLDGITTDQYGDEMILISMEAWVL